MHLVNAVDRGDALGGEGGVLYVTYDAVPLLGRLGHVGGYVEHRTYAVAHHGAVEQSLVEMEYVGSAFAEIAQALHGELAHLAYFVVERHTADDRIHTGFNRRVGKNGRSGR